MAKIGENEFKAQLKSGSLSHVYLFYGEESYLKERYISRLKKKVLEPSFADFNFHSHEGNRMNIDTILMDAQMLPVMSEYSLVLVHDYPLDKQSEDVKKLKTFFQDVPESCILVFWYDSIDINPCQNSKWNTVINLFAKAGDAVLFEKRSQGELARMVSQAAAKKGSVMSPYTAQYFITAVGSDMQTVFNELEKLCAYAQSGEITRQLVDEVAVKSLQARVYDLSKFILKGDSENAYTVLRTLFAQKEEPIGILAVISSCYVDLYRAKCVKAADIPANDLENHFSYKGREFLIKNAVRDSASLGFRKLRDSMDVLAETDEKMKSTAIDKQVLLEETVAKLLLIKDR